MNYAVRENSDEDERDQEDDYAQPMTFDQPIKPEVRQ